MFYKSPGFFSSTVHQLIVLYSLPTANSQPGFLTSAFKLLVHQVLLPDVTKFAFVSLAWSLICHCSPNNRQHIPLWPSHTLAGWCPKAFVEKRYLVYKRASSENVLHTSTISLCLDIAQHLLNHLVSLTVSTLPVELSFYLNYHFQRSYKELIEFHRPMSTTGRTICSLQLNLFLFLFISYPQRTLIFTNLLIIHRSSAKKINANIFQHMDPLCRQKSSATSSTTYYYYILFMACEWSIK